jgi:hypothetical protein
MLLFIPMGLCDKRELRLHLMLLTQGLLYFYDSKYDPEGCFYPISNRFRATSVAFTQYKQNEIIRHLLNRDNQTEYFFCLNRVLEKDGDVPP